MPFGVDSTCPSRIPYLREPEPTREVSEYSADAISAPILCLLAAQRHPSVASSADMNER